MAHDSSDRDDRRSFLRKSTNLAALPLIGGLVAQSALAADPPAASRAEVGTSRANPRHGRNVDHNQEIANLEHLFLEQLDEHNGSAVAAMFAHGTLEILVPGQPDLVGTGIEGVTQSLTKLLRPRRPNSFGRHIASNLIIEVDEAALTAKARQYTCLVNITQGQQAYVVGLGRHYDELARIDGKWWFTRKHILGDVIASPPAQAKP